jgi:ATP-dependent RNA helicase DeaD
MESFPNNTDAVLDEPINTESAVPNPSGVAENHTNNNDDDNTQTPEAEPAADEVTAVSETTTQTTQAASVEPEITDEILMEQVHSFGQAPKTPKTTPAAPQPEIVTPAVPEGPTFADLNLSDDIMAAVNSMGFVSPSPIQLQAIPPIMAGRDVIGQAQTGTGKTAAFGIPALEAIDTADRYVQTLILCPTRELALQVAEEIRKLAQFKRGVRIEAIYGGDSIERQIRSLKAGVHIVIGTPGRVMDHMQRNTLKLDHVKMMILDEADEMLDMGFREDIESILEEMPQERQTILFSATMSKPIMQITQKFQNDPVLIKVVKRELTATNIEQVFFEVKPKAKVEVMCRLIDMYDLKLLLVFTNTKRKVDEIVEDLQVRGYMAEGIHGDLRQQQRNNVMSKFRAGTTSILVATDVAARGIDVDDVDAVINYDIPLDEEYYVHRIGRTGRAGKSGRAFSLVSRDEKYRFREIQNYTKVRVEKGVIPSFEDIVGIRKARFIEQLQADIEQDTDLNLFSDVLTHLTHAGLPTEKIVAALVKRSMGIEKNEFSDQNLGLDDDRRERKDDRYSNKERGSYGDRGNDRGGNDRRGSYGNDRPSYGNRSDSPRDGGNDRRGSYGDRPAFGNRGDDRPRGDRPAFGRDDRPRDGNRNDGPRDERLFGPREGTGKRGYFEKDGQRPARTPRDQDANMTRLFVGIGREDYVRPGDIVGAIAGEADIPGSNIGHIDIHDKHTFVDVPANLADRVVAAMDGNSIKGRRVNVEVAR